MVITKKEVEHLAKLARIKMDDAEMEIIARDLEDILKYVEELKEIDAGNVAPMTGGTELFNIVREDEAREEKLSRPPREPSSRGEAGVADHRELIDQVPAEENNFVKVPRIIE